MAITDNEKLIKLALFDGIKSNFIFWEEKFLARAYKKKYINVILGKVDIPKYKIDYDDDANPPDEAKREIINHNIAAYVDLVHGLNTDEPAGKTAFRLVVKTKTREYPHGNARQAYLNLRMKYKPTTEIDKGF